MAQRSLLSAAVVAAWLMAGCRSSSAPASTFIEPRLTAVPVVPSGPVTETAAAVDPTDVDRALAAYQVPASVVWTSDALVATWSHASLPDVGAWQLAGDPAVTFDADGHAYALYIAFDRPENYDTLGTRAHRNGIFVNRSDDGGKTWRPSPGTVIAQPETPGIPFEDKPQMDVDRSADPARRGRLYVAWTEFRRQESVILFSASGDGGLTFSSPLEISDRPGSPKDSTGADEGTDIAVGADGTVYVVWSDSTGILLDRSRDDGATFGADRRIVRTGDIVFGIPRVFRANGYPSIGLDPRTGRLYVAWVDRSRGDAAVFLTTSGDGGDTWSSPAVASGAGPGNRFFAWLGVDPVTGIVVLGYYRQEADDQLSYVLSYSTDHGLTFVQRTWSQAPFDPANRFIGDYTGIDIYDGVAYAAWAGTAAGGGSATSIWMGKATLTER